MSIFVCVRVFVCARTSDVHGLRHGATGLEGRAHFRPQAMLQAEGRAGGPLCLGFVGQVAFQCGNTLSLLSSSPSVSVGWWQGVMAGSPENSFFSDAEENFKSKMPGNVSMLGGDAGHCPFPPHQLAFPHLPYPPSCSSLSCLEELGTC